MKATTGYLEYVVDNCLVAYSELCSVNEQLREGMCATTVDVDVNKLGALNRMIQDYLIVRVAGLFDKRKDAISFESLFSCNKTYSNLRDKEIIQYIIRNRHKFVAHNDIISVNSGGHFPSTERICDPVLKEILESLKGLLHSES